MQSLFFLKVQLQPLQRGWRQGCPRRTGGCSDVSSLLYPCISIHCHRMYHTMCPLLTSCSHTAEMTGSCPPCPTRYRSARWPGCVRSSSRRQRCLFTVTKGGVVLSRSVPGRPCRGTCSTATATWTTCRACASSTSCTRRWSRRWRRCSSTTCRGSRCSSWRRRWTCCASAAPRSCSPTSLPSTSRRTTSPSFLRCVFCYIAECRMLVNYAEKHLMRCCYSDVGVNPPNYRTPTKQQYVLCLRLQTGNE